MATNSQGSATSAAATLTVTGTSTDYYVHPSGQNGAYTTISLAMQAVYTADPSADKAKHRAALAGVYQRVGEAAASVNSLAALSARLKAETDKALPAGALAKIRELASAELRSTLGTDPAGTFDPARAAAVFARLSRVVGGLK